MSLAIECGATSSVVVYVEPEIEQSDIEYEQTTRFHYGPANYKLLKPLELEKFFKTIHEEIAKPEVQNLAVAMPGILNDFDRKGLKIVLSKIWPEVDNIWVGNDLESAMNRISPEQYILRSVIISGTGSCCYGTEGKPHEMKPSRKIGGYGHIIGDRGSAYAIAHRAIRVALRDFEHNHDNSIDPYANGNTINRSTFNIESAAVTTPLLQLILSHLSMNQLYELVSWSLVARKDEIANVALLVMDAAKYGNELAQSVVDESSNEIADDTVCLINKLKSGRHIPDKKICIGLTGSMFTKNTDTFTEMTIRKIREKGCLADIIILKDTVMGALEMVLDHKRQQIASLEIDPSSLNAGPKPQGPKEILSLRDQILPVATGLSETERRNVNSKNLDTMPVEEAIELMIHEEARVTRSLHENISTLSGLVNKIAGAFKSGGRLIYVGAGTSGRLGILDASECPPTFKAPPHLVQGVIAGGHKAIQNAVEGAEDSFEDGISSMITKDACEKDVVLGIAASGRTPFVWGALHEAKRRKAYTAFLTFNPHLEYRFKPDTILTVATGPEVLTGSTRLKAGTATKVVLNILTTMSMVQIGKCLENLMVDLLPVNEKLRDRALRIVMIILDDSTLTLEEVRGVLIQNHYDIKKTVAEFRKTVV